VQDGVTYRQRGPDDEWPSPEYGGRWCEVYCEAAGTTIGLGSNDLEPATLLTLARTMRRVHG
jgi:hypothetical protein